MTAETNTAYAVTCPLLGSTPRAMHAPAQLNSIVAYVTVMVTWEVEHLSLIPELKCIKVKGTKPLQHHNNTSVR